MGFKIDLHVHTQSFGRTFMTPTSVRAAVRARGLDGIAVVNFFNISHALWLKQQLPDVVILVGQEIWSRDGHIIGLGLSRKIMDFRSAEETVADIHAQGGIAVAAHPYLHLGVKGKILSVPFDAVEVYNAAVAHAFFYNALAARRAKRAGLPGVAASDTTDPRFIGQSYVEVLADRREDIIKSIARGDVHLTRRALPLPLGFIMRNFLQHRDVEPCPLHAAPCFLCGKSMIVRLWASRFICHDCGKEEFARVGCCNGHYFCLPCLAKRVHARDDQAVGDRDFYAKEIGP